MKELFQMDRQDYNPEGKVYERPSARAIILKDGKVLLNHVAKHDCYVFPGGGIEPGETPEQALIREIREELVTEISVGEKLMQVEYDYPEFHLSMGCYLCAVRSGSLILKEHESARWLRPDELDAVDWLPADRLVVRRLQKG